MTETPRTDAAREAVNCWQDSFGTSHKQDHVEAEEMEKLETSLIAAQKELEIEKKENEVLWKTIEEKSAKLHIAEQALRDAKPVAFLAALRTINVDRCVNGFKHELADWSVMEWGCAITGEAGELANVLKKIRREEQSIGGSRIEGDKTKIVADEIADVIIYCDLLAARMGINLQEAITSKFNETSSKIGYNTPLYAAPTAVQQPVAKEIIELVESMLSTQSCYEMAGSVEARELDETMSSQWKQLRELLAAPQQSEPVREALEQIASIPRSSLSFNDPPGSVDE